MLIDLCRTQNAENVSSILLRYCIIVYYVITCKSYKINQQIRYDFVSKEVHLLLISVVDFGAV